MATINNSDLFKELKDGAKLQQLRDLIPSQLADKVVPVMEVNPKLLRRINYSGSASKTVTGSAAIALPSGKEIYLTNASFSLIKDVVCDMATGVLFFNVIQNGLTMPIAMLSIITLTAQQITGEITFNTPIKVDAGSSVTLGGSYAAGVCVRGITVNGYTIDNSNA